VRPTSTPTNTPAATNTPTPTFTPSPTSTPTNTPVPPPSLSVSGACTGIGSDTAAFIVTNNGGAMTTPYTYNITDASGAVVDTGTFQLGAGGSTVITVTGTSTSYTLTSPDDSSINVTADMTICVA